MQAAKISIRKDPSESINPLFVTGKYVPREIGIIMNFKNQGGTIT
jgi:hypothetical protein